MKEDAGPPRRLPCVLAGRLIDMKPLGVNDPQRVGEYEVLAPLGVGGMGTVYLGRAPHGTHVAIKLIHPHLAADAEFRARFAGEVKAGRRVPAFCTALVLDCGDHEGRPYLVTEYIDGVPLSRLVTEDGPLDAANLHALAVGAIAGLAAIHGVGLVHRDVKPSNLIVTLGGVRIIDFGIARALDDAGEYTRTGVVMGSLGWVAPEQLNGHQVSPAMDIFGWGCLVRFAATGRHPFGGTDLNARVWNIQHGTPDLDGVSAPLRSLVAAALQPDPASRPTARELLLAVVGAPPVEGPTVRPPFSQRGSAVAVGAAAMLAAALVAGAVGLNGGATRLDRVRRPPGVPATPSWPQSGGQSGVLGGPGGESGRGTDSVTQAGSSAGASGVNSVPAASTVPYGSTSPNPTSNQGAVTAPTSKDQCKGDGWRSFTNPSFKNQGECVSYVEQHS